jgi:predicted TIM-barrel fold metal-dependent hydrolase
MFTPTRSCCWTGPARAAEAVLYSLTVPPRLAPIVFLALASAQIVPLRGQNCDAAGALDAAQLQAAAEHLQQAGRSRCPRRAIATREDFQVVWGIRVRPKGARTMNRRQVMMLPGAERAVKKHPKTMFIACHLANLDYDLTRLGQMFDRNPNLYADISARFAETAPIPRFVAAFFQRYPDRVLYGTDMAYNQRMFSTTFRILESLDEHFYERDLNFNFDCHWALNGFGLPDPILKKVYSDNARRVFRRAKANAG